MLLNLKQIERPISRTGIKAQLRSNAEIIEGRMTLPVVEAVDAHGVAAIGQYRVFGTFHANSTFIIHLYFCNTISRFPPA